MMMRWLNRAQRAERRAERAEQYDDDHWGHEENPVKTWSCPVCHRGNGRIVKPWEWATGLTTAGLVWFGGGFLAGWLL